MNLDNPADRDENARMEQSASPRAVDTPRVSVVMATRNRAPQVALAIESFRAIRTGHAWELIVVDNASTDGTWEVIESARREQALQSLRLPEPGLCRAQNAGARLARAAIIAFIDDDCYPENDYIDRLVEAFDDPQVSFIGGRVLLHDPQDLPITIQTRETPIELRPGTPLEPGLMHGANLAFRTDVFHRVGGYDERLGPGSPCRSGGDWELMLRTLAEGFAGRYDPRPTVRHHHGRRRLDEQRSLERRYDFGRGAVYMKTLLAGGAHRANLCWLRRSIRETIRAPRRDLRNVRARGRELMGACRFLLASGFGGRSA
jgi:glycosyltransferase involved in cell wall biosynthesis